MPRQLQLEMHSQPDDTTCGPTCLHAVYRYYDDELSLEQVIREVPALEQGGTLAVMLGIHALRRGYRATIYTYNLRVFDPTWFVLTSSKHRLVPTYQAAPTIVERLGAQMQAKHSARLQAACQAYIDFCQLGGQLRMQDLNAALIRKYLKRSVPILTGLSFTYLYHCPREVEPAGTVDDIRGQATGHFVVLCGYDKQRKTVQVADPYPNPLGEDNVYEVGLDRLVCAILLGVLTYDANLLIIEPRRSTAGTSLQSDPLHPAA
jgi:hypothetical protein